jgi:hypothetical protein
MPVRPRDQLQVRASANEPVIIFYDALGDLT